MSAPRSLAMAVAGSGHSCHSRVCEAVRDVRVSIERHEAGDEACDGSICYQAGVLQLQWQWPSPRVPSCSAAVCSGPTAAAGPGPDQQQTAAQGPGLLPSPGYFAITNRTYTSHFKLNISYSVFFFFPGGITRSGVCCQ